MIDGKRVLAVVPARGGSKGIKRKNLRSLGGRSLLEWTIREAKASRYVDQIAVSTEDSEIAAEAERLGVKPPFARPAHLATDEAASIDVVLHVIESLPGFDYVVLLQPTSPFRDSSDIDACLELCRKRPGATVVSVCAVSKPPEWMYKFQEGRALVPFLKSGSLARRQDSEALYQLNGAVYVSEASQLSQQKALVGETTEGYVMPPERSLDIDTELDWVFAEALAKNQGPKK